MSNQKGRSSAKSTGRREPPPFRHVAVRYKEALSPFMLRVTFSGSQLEGFEVTEPAASVRLLLPSPDASELVMPEWNGNEFLLPDGTRPLIRTFTPRRVDTATSELDLDMVIHPGGAASAWAQGAVVGSPAAVSGPGRGYRIDGNATDFLLAGDETAIPALSQLLEVIPEQRPIAVHIEIAHPDACIELPQHPGASVHWHVRSQDALPGDTLLEAVISCEIGAETKVWCAGEAAAMHRIRRHLFDDRGVARSQGTVRGYWKLPRADEEPA